MKKIQIGAFLIITIFFYGCQKDELNPNFDLEGTISLQIEKTNSDNNFKSKAQTLSLKEKSAGWRLNDDGRIQLTREAIFDLELENGEHVDFILWFIKYEQNGSLLVLEDEELNPWDRRWDYKTIDAEISNFYTGFDEARVIINGANVIFHHEMNDDFFVERVEEVGIDGKEKSYLTIDLSGTAFGFYDPSGVYQEVYTLTAGTFKGVIE